MHPTGNISFNPTNRLTLSEMVCDQLEWLSDDSDDGKETKYNILEETDIIEEEDEAAEEDEEDADDYGIEATNHQHIPPKGHNIQYNNFVDPVAEQKQNPQAQ